MRVLARKGLQRLSNHPRQHAAASISVKEPNGRRHVQIQAAPSSDSTADIETTPESAATPDAVFEVIGSPYSLLSVALSPSQPLHTRRGTLVSLSGDPTTTISTLHLLSALRRAPLGIPFLYQRLTTTTPITALISPNSPSTSLAVLHLTGTTDWKLTNRKALLAWTGTTLSLQPTLNRSLNLTNWGNTSITGRGLVALVGKGNLFSITLRENEIYIAHPSNILAYSIPPTASSTNNPPQPFRFKSSPSFNLQIPNFGTFFPRSRFFETIRRDSETYKFLASLIHRIRTWSRRTIFGDRLFLQFTGPTTILIQSRASRVRDVLSEREVNEIADAPAGVVGQAIDKVVQQREKDAETGVVAEAEKERQRRQVPETIIRKPPKLRIASVQRDGKVRIEETEDFEGWKR